MVFADTVDSPEPMLVKPFGAITTSKDVITGSAGYNGGLAFDVDERVSKSDKVLVSFSNKYFDFVTNLF